MISPQNKSWKSSSQTDCRTEAAQKKKRRSTKGRAYVTETFLDLHGFSVTILRITKRDLLYHKKINYKFRS